MNIPKTQVEELEVLTTLGFQTTPDWFVSRDILEIWNKGSAFIKQKLNLDYPVDGLVVKINNNKYLDDLGVVGKTHRGWCAIKSHQKEVSTRLLDVRWQIGRTGKLTPVAILEPIELDGSIIKKATLHNYKEFMEKNLQKQDWLIVHKAGDIIPEVIKVLYNLRISKTEKSDFSPEGLPFL
jgi:DNA ligase (NAD+)